MDYGTHLVKLVDKRVEELDDGGFRSHLGASIVGDECQRYVWLSWRWTYRHNFPGRMLRLFERGHREELMFVKLLRDLGATVWTEDPHTGNQFRISAAGGHFGGSCDGVAQHLPNLGDEPVLCEMKTHNDKSFTKLTKQGLVEAVPKHYYQAQIYMRLLGLKRALYMAVNKNDDSLYFLLFDLVPSHADQLIERGVRLVFQETAPNRISNDPKWWKCRFCDASSVCFGTAMPEVNCRTCAHSSPEQNGTWSCRRGQPEIKDNPKSGCGQHVFNPNMIFSAQVESMCFDENWISYRTKRGNLHYNGPDKTPSSQLDLIGPC